MNTGTQMRKRIPVKSRRPIAEINVVPYIDVMLVLLIIFMITAPLLAQGVKVELPVSEAQSIDNVSKEPIIVSVDRDGRFYLNIAEQPEAPMTAESIAISVAAHLVLDKDRSVLINGDQGVSYGQVVHAMALLQKSGVKSIGLITQPPEKT